MSFIEQPRQPLDYSRPDHSQDEGLYAGAPKIASLNSYGSIWY